MSYGSLLVGLLKALPEYLTLTSTQQALLIPAAMSIFFWNTGPKRQLPALSALLFVAGCALSVVFSVFRDTAGLQELHALPGYGLLAILVPVQYQPSWRQVFALGFASLLVADVWGAAVHFLSTGPLPETFYYGVGGLGFNDALFITPSILGIAFAVIEWLRRRGIADRRVGPLLKALLVSRSQKDASR